MGAKKSEKTLNDLVQAVKDSEDNKTKPYDTTATVTRVEDGKAWVHIPGGVTETPAELTINAKPGDNVMVRVAGGRAFLLGNATNPPTDDATAKKALSNANDALQSAINARIAADSAETSAETARTAAESAVEDASTAREAAESAQADATAAKQDAASAKTSATEAKADAAAAASAASEARNTANAAKKSADNANEYAARALGGLSTVQSVTETLNWVTQHGTMTRTTDRALDPTHVYFVRDNNGDYVVGNVHYSVVTEPKLADISTYYELSIDESLNNYVATHLAVTSEGLWIIPDASGNKVLIATGQGSTYTTAGTYIVGSGGDVLAKFAESEIIVGKNDNTEAYLKLDFHSLQLIDREGDNRFVVKDLRNEQGLATITEEFVGDGTTNNFYVGATITSVISATVNGTPVTPAYAYGYGVRFSTAPQKGASIIITYTTNASEAWIATIGERASGTEGLSSVAIGQEVVASGARSQAFGYRTIASGRSSHAEGSYVNLNDVNYYPTASGDASHAEGRGTTASGEASHAEGSLSVASGDASHAEGEDTTASGDPSHAEGLATTASGYASHAEGTHTIASGNFSHAQNNNTIAAKDNQTVLGKYNLEDTATSTTKQKALIIGNGTSNSARSNALEVDWGGNVKYAGKATGNNGTRDIELNISEATISAYVALGMSLT